MITSVTSLSKVQTCQVCSKPSKFPFTEHASLLDREALLDASGIFVKHRMPFLWHPPGFFANGNCSLQFVRPVAMPTAHCTTLLKQRSMQTHIARQTPDNNVSQLDGVLPWTHESKRDELHLLARESKKDELELLTSNDNHNKAMENLSLPRLR